MRFENVMSPGDEVTPLVRTMNETHFAFGGTRVMENLTVLIVSVPFATLNTFLIPTIIPLRLMYDGVSFPVWHLIFVSPFSSTTSHDALFTTAVVVVPPVVAVMRCSFAPCGATEQEDGVPVGP